MGIFNLLGGKIKGRDMTFVIRMESPVPYPEQDIRWEKYGSPLCSLVNQYFDEIAVEYFKDQSGRLDQINLVCYKSKVRYKKSEEGEVIASLFRAVSHRVEAFFEEMGSKGIVEDLYIPSAPSLQDYVVSSVRAKLDATEESAMIQTPSEPEKPAAREKSTESSRPAIIRSPETGKDNLISPLGKTFDISDMETEGVTISRAEDGRYLVGFISKRDDNRYYVEVPEELGKKLMSDKKYTG